MDAAYTRLDSGEAEAAAPPLSAHAPAAAGAAAPAAAGPAAAPRPDVAAVEMSVNIAGRAVDVLRFQWRVAHDMFTEWTVQLPNEHGVAEPTAVRLEHGLRFGKRLVTVNGVVAYEGRRLLEDGCSTHPFRWRRWSMMVRLLNTVQTGWQYDFFIEQQPAIVKQRLQQPLPPAAPQSRVVPAFAPPSPYGPPPPQMPAPMQVQWMAPPPGARLVYAAPPQAQAAHYPPPPQQGQAPPAYVQYVLVAPPPGAYYGQQYPPLPPQYHPQYAQPAQQAPPPGQPPQAAAAARPPPPPQWPSTSV